MKFYLFYLLALIASTLYMSSILHSMTERDCAYNVQAACDYINPDYYLYQKIKEQQEKILRLTDELADANFTIKKLQQKESLKCQK